MKKLLFSLFTLAIFQITSAQIVMNLADIASIGTVYAIGVDTMVGPTIVAGPGGTGQSWNFAATNTIYIDTVKIVDPATTPYSSFFPPSTFCSERFTFGDTIFFYVSANATDMRLNGIVLDALQSGNKFKIATTPPSLIMSFPYQLSSSYSDTSSGEVWGSGSDINQTAIDSFRYKSTSLRSVTVDGEGNLTLVNGAYSVLREKEISRALDSIWVKFPFLGWSLFQDTDVTDSTYRWISDSLGLNVATLSFDTLGNEKQLEYYDPNPPVVSRIVMINQTLNVSPNPANDNFRFNNPSGGKSVLIIRNASGKNVYEIESFEGINQIETGFLTNGIYFLELTSGQNTGRMTGKLVVLK